MIGPGGAVIIEALAKLERAASLMTAPPCVAYAIPVTCRQRQFVNPSNPRQCRSSDMRVGAAGQAGRRRF